MHIDRAAFFAHARGTLFGGRLAAGQVCGVEAILDQWERHGGQDARHLAYILATAFHETGRSMQPVAERGGADYFRRRYDIAGERPQVARELGNVEPGDGERFHGRGFVQLTGRRNYALASARLGVDLVGDPEAARKSALAARILVEGMAQGWFTGRRLADFFNDAADDPLGARRIVNGSDRARLIAGHHRAFLAALAAAGPVPSPVPTKEKPPMTLPSLVLDLIAAAVRQAVVKTAADPAAAKDGERLAEAAVRKAEGDPRLRDLAAAHAHATNGEPWYRSRVTWGALVAGAASLAGAFGITLAPADLEVAIGLLTAGGTLAGAALTLYGRWRARIPLGV